MRVRRSIDDAHLVDALDLSGGLRRRRARVPGDQQVHGLPDLYRGGDRIQCAHLERRIVVLGNNQGGHVSSSPESRHGIAFASFLSFATSSSTLFTTTPALRLDGSSTFKVLSRGDRSTPKSCGLTTSSVFFFAFMMLGNVT